MLVRSEKSCGAIVFTRIDGEIKYLLIRSLAGIYGFPKGHTENGESEMETALREVSEEVGLDVKLIPGFRVEDEYIIRGKEDTLKKVVYFLGEYFGEKFIYQKEELSAALLVDYETAMDMLQFDSNKQILKKANAFLADKSNF